MMRLDSARLAADSDAAKKGKSGEGAVSRRQDIPAARQGPSSILTQHSSGSLIDGRASSLDLGLLPPREMQVQSHAIPSQPSQWLQSAKAEGFRSTRCL